MKQIDRIRNMNAEELAEFIINLFSEYAEVRYCFANNTVGIHCAYEDKGNCLNYTCKNAMKDWKATCRNWARREQKNDGKLKSKPSFDINEIAKKAKLNEDYEI